MSEDQGWARDTLRAGYGLVYEPTAAVLHSHSYTMPKLFRRNFDSGHSLSVLLAGENISFLSYGAGYLVRELLDFARAGHASRLPYLALYEVVRAAGFFAGRNADRLPLRIQRYCSDYQLYWGRSEPTAPCHAQSIGPNWLVDQPTASGSSRQEFVSPAIPSIAVQHPATLLSGGTRQVELQLGWLAPQLTGQCQRDRRGNLEHHVGERR